MVDAAPELRELAVDSIDPWPEQPRKYFDPASISELATSIKKHGLLEPIVVRRKQGRFQLVMGERRLRAAVEAGLKAIPAVIREFASDQDAFEASLAENISRKSLTLVEMGEGFQQMIQRGVKRKEIAEIVGCHWRTVHEALIALMLPEPVRELNRQGKLGWNHLAALKSIRDPADTVKLAQRAAREKLSAAALSALAREFKKPRAKTTNKPAGARDLEQRFYRTFGATCDLDYKNEKFVMVLRGTLRQLDDIVERFEV